jgi:hypothetical protein
MIPILLGITGKLNALLARVTPGRAANLDRLDVPVSSRAPASTALSTTVWTQAHADATLAGGGITKSAQFGTPGPFQFQVPPGVTLLFVTLQGPGGVGGVHYQGGGGGGSGELLRRIQYPVGAGALINGYIGPTYPPSPSTFGTLAAAASPGTGSQSGAPGGGPLGGAGGTGGGPGTPSTPGQPGGTSLDVVGGGGGGGGAYGGGGHGAPCGRFAGGQTGGASGSGAASYFSAGGDASYTQPTRPGPGAGGGGSEQAGVFSPGGDGYCLIEWIG